tara:strand:- start:144 stop:899 length:756 start_codon:yes stop_codon:yes gene_type:complete
MEIEKARLVISHFLDIDSNDIDQFTIIDHTVIKSSLLLHRMYAALAKEGYILEDPASIVTFGDFVKAITQEVDSLSSTQSLSSKKESKQSNKEEIQSIFSVGVDMEKVSQLEETDDYFNNIFYKENFTFDEIKYCTSKANAQQSFAALFATKEAIVKADNSYKKTKFNNINISHNETNKPYFKDFSISISHTEDFVVAVAVKLNSNIMASSIQYPNIKNANQNDTNLNKALKILAILSLGILSIFLILKFL